MTSQWLLYFSNRETPSPTRTSVFLYIPLQLSLLNAPLLKINIWQTSFSFTLKKQIKSICCRDHTAKHLCLQAMCLCPKESLLQTASDAWESVPWISILNAERAVCLTSQLEKSCLLKEGSPSGWLLSALWLLWNNAGRIRSVLGKNCVTAVCFSQNYSCPMFLLFDAHKNQGLYDGEWNIFAKNRNVVLSTPVEILFNCAVQHLVSDTKIHADSLCLFYNCLK